MLKGIAFMDLYDIIQRRSNNYSPLEAKYRSVTGDELVLSPFMSVRRRLSEITQSATIIIPAWNSKRSLEQCLTSIEQSSFNHRYPQLLDIIVVDDGSSDDTWELLSHLHLTMNFRAVRQKHHGRAHARNIGISLASGDVIICCDSDIILCPFTIEELMKRHQVLKGVLLVGFIHSNIDGSNHDFLPSVMTDKLPFILPTFYDDYRVRFHWPGWPENMCVETNHFKSFGYGRQIWVTKDGRTPDGDSFSLQRMVGGGLFSLCRDDFQRIGGFDERFHGWGWEDAAVGAQAFAQGKFIVPVYSAVGFHIAHPNRSPKKWHEADINQELYLSILHSQPVVDDQVLVRARQRITSQIQSSFSGSSHNVPASWLEIFTHALADPNQLGKYYYHLGFYNEAVAAFSAVKGSEIDEAWAFFNQGRALRAARRYIEAIAILEKSVHALPSFAPPLIELGLALASNGDFLLAHNCLQKVRQYEPNNRLASYVLDCSTDNHLRRGRRYAAQGDHALAIRDFEAILIQEPSNAVARHERAKSLSACS